MDINDYGPAKQKLFLEIMLADAQCFTRVQNIFNEENFEKSLQSPAKFIKEYVYKYHSIPTHEQVTASTGSTFDHITNGVGDAEQEWFLDEFEGFTKQKELHRAIVKSSDLLASGKTEQIEKLIKDAVQVSLTRDLGLDYFEDPRARLLGIKNQNGQVKTGWDNLDKILYGGFNRGELEIFAGGSGAGKSLFLQNLAINWITAPTPLDGIYITHELSQDFVAMRLDSMITNIASKEIFRELDNVEMKVKMAGKKAGSLYVKYLPSQSTVNDIRAYVRELQVKTGRRISFICHDYLDLLMPAGVKINASDLFVKDKYVSEELRNLAKELNVVMASASQLNRASVEEVEFDHSHISGGISKINTADNVFGIFTSRSMREHGRYQLQLMKTRTSSGVGQKVDLGFDVNSLRITDLGEDATPASMLTNKFASNILSGIKPKSTVTPSVNTSDSGKAEVNSVRLKQMLADLKKNG
jgi:hypothetical protein